jgi:hypothetical protein
MHRSGTSTVSRLLNLLGFDMCPADDLVGACWSNPTGHWESQRLLTFNEGLLSIVGASWQTPPPVAADSRLAALATIHREQGRRTFAASYPRPGWVWKDPHNTVTFAVLASRARPRS